MPCSHQHVNDIHLRFLFIEPGRGSRSNIYVYGVKSDISERCSPVRCPSGYGAAFRFPKHDPQWLCLVGSNPTLINIRRDIRQIPYFFWGGVRTLPMGMYDVEEYREAGLI